MMLASMLRFWWYGWIDTLYVEPAFHFTYWGFGWIKPLGATGMHLLFAVLTLAALSIALGFLYRLATVVFFLAFVYVELIDVATYLNHYYFVSLVAFLLIWLPAGRHYSLDVVFWPQKRREQAPFIAVGILRFQMAVVYVFAGLAKLHPDWLLKALPMSIWLPAKSHLPIVGPYMYHPYTAYLFSWFGAVYDLFIVFFLLSGRTRAIAYGFVVLFHAATALFFPAIGMFPYIMIGSSLIFFSAGFHEKLLAYLPGYQPVSTFSAKPAPAFPHRLTPLIALYMCAQLIIPFRYLLYPGPLFWNEEGYRFSWRVMLMEKSGVAYFRVKSAAGPATYEVNNAEFLTPLQEKMMSTQPDMILRYAHFLAKEYKKRGVVDPAVQAEVYVALNGRHSALFIDSTVNLAAERFSWQHYAWVLPFNK